MGQQQLILLVLAVVIVGVAIVVGIRAFSENSIKSNADAMIQDAVRVANDMQAWKQKPAPFGGQGSTQAQTVVQDPNDFTDATFARLGYAPNASGNYLNLNGRYAISVASADSTVIRGVSTQYNNEIRVDVTGLSDLTIRGNVVCLGGIDSAGSACTPTTIP